jgi:hypothetical protein
MSLATTSLNRAGLGAAQAFETRYRVYPLLLIPVLYIVFCQIVTKKYINIYFSIFLLFSLLLYSITFNVYLKHIKARSYSFQYDALIYKTDPEYASLSYPNQIIAKDLMKSFIARGLYQMPVPSLELFSTVQSVRLPGETNNITHNFDNFIGGESGPYLKITGWAITKGISSYQSTVSIVLNSASETYVIDSKAIDRPDVTKGFTPRNHLYTTGPIDTTTYNYDDSGFFVFIPKKSFVAGVYKVGILIRRTDGTYARQFTDRTVTI